MGRKHKKVICVKDMQMAFIHMKICSTSLIIREMQIKMTLRYHFYLSDWQTLKRSATRWFRRGCGEARAHVHAWRECKQGQPPEGKFGSIYHDYLCMYILTQESHFRKLILKIYFKSRKVFMHKIIHSGRICNCKMLDAARCPNLGEDW